MCDNTSKQQGTSKQGEKLLALSIKGIKPTGEQNCKNPEKKQVLVSSATLHGPKSKMDQIRTE